MTRICLTLLVTACFAFGVAACATPCPKPSASTDGERPGMLGDAAEDWLRFSEKFLADLAAAERWAGQAQTELAIALGLDGAAALEAIGKAVAERVSESTAQGAFLEVDGPQVRVHGKPSPIGANLAQVTAACLQRVDQEKQRLHDGTSQYGALRARGEELALTAQAAKVPASSPLVVRVEHRRKQLEGADARLKQAVASLSRVEATVARALATAKVPTSP